MTKIKCPLMSESASGSIAQGVTFRETKKGVIATGKHFPGSKNNIIVSDGQAQIRAKFSQNVAAWNLLTQIEKDTFSTRARPLQLSGWNLYLSENMELSKIDYSNPLTETLVASFMVVDGSAQSIKELITEVDYPSESNTVVSFINNENGVGASFDNSTLSNAQGFGFNIGDIPQLKIESEITILQGVVLREVPGGINWGRGISKSNGSALDIWANAFDSSGSPSRRTLHFRLNSVSLGGQVIQAETFTNLASRYKSGLKSISVNGLLVTSINSQSGPIQTDGTIKIGNHGSESERGFRGDIFYTHIFNSYLSDAEIISMAADPYQFIN